MRSRIFTTLAALLALFVFVTPQIQAHDDGLTCHSHPTTRDIDFIGGSVMYLDVTESSFMLHSFQNLIAKDPKSYDPADVEAAVVGLGEFNEMVEIVRMLMVRAERIADPGESEAAQRAARDAFDRLPISGYLSFDIFREKNRLRGGVVSPFDALVRYLEVEAGVPGELIAVVGQAEGEC